MTTVSLQKLLEQSKRLSAQFFDFELDNYTKQDFFTYEKYMKYVTKLNNKKYDNF